MRSFEYTIKDELGIHARPAGKLAAEAKKFISEAVIGINDKTALCTRLMAVMGLGIKKGDTVTITINGRDEESAEKALKKFFQEQL